MIVVAIGFAGLVATGFMVVRWAWREQRSGAASDAGRAVGPAPAARVTVSCTDDTMASVWTRERASSGLIGWKRMRLLGVLGDGSTVILACRRQTSRLVRPPHLARRTRSNAAAGLAPEDRTIVLVVGADEDHALALLEHWREEGACLRVRIPSGPSAVELSEEGGRAVLRALLVAA